MTCLLLCSALIAGFLNVRAEPRYYEQNFNSLHVPELDAGFHPPYELKFPEAAISSGPGSGPTRKTLLVAPQTLQVICSRSASGRAS